MRLIRKVTRNFIKTKLLLPTDVLEQKMRVYDNEARKTLQILIEKTNEFGKQLGFDKEILAHLKSLNQLMHKLDEVVIDCAHKLAPYTAPKLESIEVKSKIEHKFVIKAPQAVKSVDEWAKITGAKQAKIEEMTPTINRIIPPAPSIHDYEEEDIEDQRKTLLN